MRPLPIALLVLVAVPAFAGQGAAGEPLLGWALDGRYVEVGDQVWMGPAGRVVLYAADVDGVAEIWYEVDAGPRMPYTAPFALSGHGAHDVVAGARDAEGSEAMLAFRVYLDASAPTLTIVTPREGAVHINDRMIVADDGATTWSYDLAGAVPPPAEARGTIASPFAFETDGRTWVLHAVRVESDAADAGAGVANVRAFVDGVALGTDREAPYTHDWDALRWPEGEHVLRVVATDLFGQETAVERTVVVGGRTLFPGIRLA